MASRKIVVVRDAEVAKLCQHMNNLNIKVLGASTRLMLDLLQTSVEAIEELEQNEEATRRRMSSGQHRSNEELAFEIASHQLKQRHAERKMGIGFDGAAQMFEQRIKRAVYSSILEIERDEASWKVTRKRKQLATTHK